MAYERNDAFAETFTEIGRSEPPYYLNRRFDAEGNFLPQPGNTVVSHVVDGSPTQQALVRIREMLKALPYGDRFAYTPVSSLHMTVFQGTIEGRRKPAYWPQELACEAPIDETTTFFLDRLKAFPEASNFRMRPVEVTPLGVVVTGATYADEQSIRVLRDQLTVPFGYSHPDHDSYTFHITLAYLKAWLPAGAETTYLPALAELTRELAAEVEVLELEVPAFCTFNDMTEFKPQHYLA
ncbi:MAG TPA: DUF1868 domain-containing protein [Mesorhizobium sp.]|uniref:DUF1868 domain-containing protein n=1 Tax=Mesorhizobium sp. TaxID=1871066 RepID=UPI002DDD33E2|nr:DUF1868 domain-containing protein [Mesorhizobium sp.]HEV2501430.1 DUF1868 domain-containing protein [Mesorhizobium sp.]